MVYDFYKALGESARSTDSSMLKGFSVLLGNYSDKNTILTKIINAKAKFENDSKVPIVKEDINIILEKIRTQSFDYYSDLFKDVFEQYNLLFKLTNNNLNLDLDFKGDIKIFNSNIQLISKYLIEGNLESDLKIAFIKEDPNDRKLNFIEEIHYSKYKHMGLQVNSLNQLTIEYYKIFNNVDMFNQFISLQESELIKKHKKAFGSNFIDFQAKSKEGIKEYTEYIGEDYNSYKETFITTRKGFSGESNLLEVDNKLNPLVRK
jgi:hypothetical protein